MQTTLGLDLSGVLRLSSAELLAVAAPGADAVVPETVAVVKLGILLVAVASTLAVVMPEIMSVV